MPTLDPAVLAEFLAIGARLLVIKTRALLPRTEPVGRRDGEEDPGEQLARQLREYSRFKQVATALKERDLAGLRTFLRVVPPTTPAPPPLEGLPSLDVTLDQLHAAIERRLRLLQSEPPPIAVPTPKILTIAEVAAELHRRLMNYAWVTFDDLLGLAVTRTEVIVTLWTVLELFKRRAITIEQPELFEPIAIGRGPDFGTWEDIQDSA
jgi:segregation and condensation protein A